MVWLKFLVVGVGVLMVSNRFVVSVVMVVVVVISVKREWVFMVVFLVGVFWVVMGYVDRMLL